MDPGQHTLKNQGRALHYILRTEKPIKKRNNPLERESLDRIMTCVSLIFSFLLLIAKLLKY